MSEQKQGIYEFHKFQLDIGKGLLLRENQPVNLQWKTFELLCMLVKSNGKLLTRDELIDELWADTFVEDNNLSQHIRALRKSLGENGGASEKFIETVAGRGYRFLPAVQVISAAGEKEAAGAGENGNQFFAEDSSKKTVSLPLTDAELAPGSYNSGIKTEAETIAYNAAQPFEAADFKTEAIGEETSRRASVIKQETGNQPETINRQRGFRRGLKCLLWGAGAVFVFFALFRVLQNSSGALSRYQSNLPADAPEGLTDMLGGVLTLLLIPVEAGYFIGIGLMVFGIARMIYSSFEKKNPKLEPSFFERWISVIIISVIAAVAIPNLIATYRTAKEIRQQKQSLPDNLTANRRPPPFLDFSGAKYQKIIENQHGEAAISPDGRFIVYTDIVGDKQSLWLRQIAANTNIQILPPTEADYRRLKFSDDSEFIYFNHKDNLYRVSVLGGEPVLVLKEIRDFSFSPDQKKIVFTKPLPYLSEYQCGLFIYDGEGGEPQKISERQSPNCYKSVAWSPDGKSIAFAVGQSDTGDANTELFIYQIADGQEISFSEVRWFHINSLVWLPDQRGIILTGRRKLRDENQIWQVDHLSGETRQLTNGTARFVQLSLTRDGNRLLTTQAVLDSYLSVAPADSPSNIRKMGSAFYGLAWLANNKIVYSSHADRDSLWTIKSDGSERKQLTFEDAGYLNPTTPADGRHVFYTLSNDGVQHIWRMNPDGSDKIQLTFGSGEQKPNVSADGEWLFYQTSGKTSVTIWKVPTAGGEPIQITNDYSTNASVSPDGKWLAFFGRREASKDVLEIKIMSLEDLQIVRQISLSEGEFFATGRILWTADSKSVLYTKEKIDRIPNIWMQPLSGAAAKQISNFTNERIFDFAPSPDGKRLGIIRGSWKNEAVLISGFK